MGERWCLGMDWIGDYKFGIGRLGSGIEDGMGAQRLGEK